MYCTNAVKSSRHFATCYTLYSTILCRQILARILAIQHFYTMVYQSYLLLSVTFVCTYILSYVSYAYLNFLLYDSCLFMHLHKTGKKGSRSEIVLLLTSILFLLITFLQNMSAHTIYVLKQTCCCARWVINMLWRKIVFNSIIIRCYY